MGLAGKTKRAGRNSCARASLFVNGLVPETQFLDDLSVGIDVRALQVIEQTATLSVHLEEPTTTVVVVLVGPEVVIQILDALREERDLNASRAGVGRVRPVLLDGRNFVESHVPECCPPAWRLFVSFCVSSEA